MAKGVRPEFLLVAGHCRRTTRSVGQEAENRRFRRPSRRSGISAGGLIATPISPATKSSWLMGRLFAATGNSLDARKPMSGKPRRLPLAKSWVQRRSSSRMRTRSSWPTRRPHGPFPRGSRTSSPTSSSRTGRSIPTRTTTPSARSSGSPVAGVLEPVLSEVMTDQQTIAFKPDLYLDTKSVREIKQRSPDVQRAGPGGDLGVPDTCTALRAEVSSSRRGVPGQNTQARLSAAAG